MNVSEFKEFNKVQKEDIEAGLTDIKNGNKKDFHKVIAKYKSNNKTHNPNYGGTLKIGTSAH